MRRGPSSHRDRGCPPRCPSRAPLCGSQELGRARCSLSRCSLRESARVRRRPLCGWAGGDTAGLGSGCCRRTGSVRVTDSAPRPANRCGPEAARNAASRCNESPALSQLNSESASVWRIAAGRPGHVCLSGDWPGGYRDAESLPIFEKWLQDSGGFRPPPALRFRPPPAVRRSEAVLQASKAVSGLNPSALRVADRRAESRRRLNWMRPTAASDPIGRQPIASDRLCLRNPSAAQSAAAAAPPCDTAMPGIAAGASSGGDGRPRANWSLYHMADGLEMIA